jgi:hypothetical protein
MKVTKIKLLKPIYDAQAKRFSQIVAIYCTLIKCVTVLWSQRSSERPPQRDGIALRGKIIRSPLSEKYSRLGSPLFSLPVDESPTMINVLDMAGRQKQRKTT